MKRILLAVIAATLVLVPVPAEAKKRPSQSCVGVVTVEHKHGKRIVDRRAVCFGKQAPTKRGSWALSRSDWD